MASPGVNVSFAVTIGTILRPALGLDHFEFLDSTVNYYEQENSGSETHLIAVLTSSACDLHITKISCTPARARLSNVQSSNEALHIGSRH
jgi:hypothetical protein